MSKYERIDERSWLGRLWPAWGEAEIEIQRRREITDNMILDLKKLQQSIGILQRAIKNPPRGVTDEEMIFVKHRLQSALQTEQKVILCLENVGVYSNDLHCKKHYKEL